MLQHANGLISARHAFRESHIHVISFRKNDIKGSMSAFRIAGSRLQRQEHMG